MITTLDENAKAINMEERTLSRITICRIHVITLHLLSALEVYPWQGIEAEDSSDLIIQRTYELGQSVRGISETALVEAFLASIAFQYYLLEEREIDKVKARTHLLKIRELLHLDEMFKAADTVRGKAGEGQSAAPVEVRTVR